MESERARRYSGQLAGDFAPAAVSNLQIVIPHRTPQFTRAALKYAACLTDGLNARIRLIDIHVVPYDALGWLKNTSLPYTIGLIGILVGLGHSVLAMSGDPKPQLALQFYYPSGQDEIFYLGPHAPHLTPKEIDLLHGIWLEFSSEVAPDEIHHHDVVHFALEELAHGIKNSNRSAVVSRLRQHLERIKNGRTPAVR